MDLKPISVMFYTAGQHWWALTLVPQSNKWCGNCIGIGVAVTEARFHVQINQHKHICSLLC